jgi:transcriptional regulator with XRE-family HTH domain
MSNHPTTYAELADVLTSLPVLLREARRQRRLSIRAAAVQIGISFSTVDRIERGHDHTIDNAIAVFRWLDEPRPHPSQSKLIDEPEASE